MNDSADFIDALENAILHPKGGVVGLVDDVLGLCKQNDFHLEWRDAQCRVRARGSKAEKVIDVPLPRSIFRVILARIAALCNERVPNSVSPYGGQGTLSSGSDLAATLRVAWVNTLAEQRLELMPAGAAREESLPADSLLKPDGPVTGEATVSTR